MIKTKNYEISKQNYRKIIRKEFIKNSKSFIVFTALILFGVASLSIYGYVNVGSNKILESWIPFLVFLAIFWLYMLYYYPYTASKSTLNKLAFHQWQYTFNEVGFTAESNEEHKISAKYSKIPRISINNDYFMFYFGTTFTLLVPKDAFQNESEFYEVINNF